MNTENIFPIVIYPETKKIHVFFTIFFLIFGIFPFFLGIFIGKYILCLSIPFMIIFAYIFNVFTNQKYELKDWDLYSHGEKIGISNEGIYLTFNNQPNNFYKWEDIIDFELNIIAFDGMTTNETTYTGNENTILLNTINSGSKKIQFYIKENQSFDYFIKTLKDSILPIAYKHKKVKFENLIFIELDYNEKQYFKEQYNISHYTGKIHYK